VARFENPDPHHPRRVYRHGRKVKAGFYLPLIFGGLAGQLLDFQGPQIKMRLQSCATLFPLPGCHWGKK
jgi:hypothetical protein